MIPRCMLSPQHTQIQTYQILAQSPSDCQALLSLRGPKVSHITAVARFSLTTDAMMLDMCIQELNLSYLLTHDSETVTFTASSVLAIEENTCGHIIMEKGRDGHVLAESGVYMGVCHHLFSYFLFFTAQSKHITRQSTVSIFFLKSEAWRGLCHEGTAGVCSDVESRNSHGCVAMYCILYLKVQAYG